MSPSLGTTRPAPRTSHGSRLPHPFLRCRIYPLDGAPKRGAKDQSCSRSTHEKDPQTTRAAPRGALSDHIGKPIMIGAYVRTAHRIPERPPRSAQSSAASGLRYWTKRGLRPATRGARQSTLEVVALVGKNEISPFVSAISAAIAASKPTCVLCPAGTSPLRFQRRFAFLSRTPLIRSQQ
jgi:hypothetical protein